MALMNVREEIRRRGWFQTIPIGSLGPNEIEQYDRDNILLKRGRRQFGAFNRIDIINQSYTTLMILPDFSSQRAIIVPPSSIISRDEITYQEFEVRNIGSELVLPDTVFITFGYEPPIMRERAELPAGARKKGW